MRLAHFAYYVITGLFIFFGLTSNAQEVQTPTAAGSRSELAQLRDKIEAQSQQIEALTREVIRLARLVEKQPVSLPANGAKPVPTAAAIAVVPGNAHVVAKGENLTSIAKQYGVTVEELQTYNKIVDDRKLQIGQTILIPPSKAPPQAKPSPSPIVPPVS